jgi:hypothetical protein
LRRFNLSKLFCSFVIIADMLNRSFIAVLLALVLGLTSQSMAVARGASAATGQMVLCTGAGPVAVYLDAKGQPTSAPHICPDSALNISVAGPVALLDAPARLIVFRRFVGHPKVQEIARPKLRPDTRAPPVTV